MPSSTSRHTLARQWELLKRLPTRGVGKSAKQISEELVEAGFKVSKRQVERDLLDLQAIFSLDCNDAGIPYGWRWPPQGSADLPALTLAEALSLKIVEDTLKPLLPRSVFHALETRFAQATAKLTALNRHTPTAKWADKVRTVAPALPLLPPAINLEILETLQEALLQDRQIEARYRGMNGKVMDIQLHPLGLVNRGPVTYLVATAYDYADVRLYALHRFSGAGASHEPVRRPKGFVLDRYIQDGALQFGKGTPLKLVVRITPELARYLDETPLAIDQEIKEKAGAVVLKATVLDTWQLRWWLLSQGALLRVLKPVALAREIAQTHAQAAAQYA